MKNKVYKSILSSAKNGNKLFATLIDPDKYTKDTLEYIVTHKAVDLILVGGSLVNSNESTEKLLNEIKRLTQTSAIIFPGSINQISPVADALLFLSLISGRNPELLIGQHVMMAPAIKQMNLETISTGYMLFESGKLNTAQYISQSLPLPADKPDVAVATALAGEMLGMKMIYMDAGSGAKKTVQADIIQAVKKSVNIPVIVGGGMTSISQINEVYTAGADIVVVGNKLEQDPEFLEEIAMVKVSS